ncbi:MAG: Wzz/FepE/Etk N-terminal domain-containing protein [Syntrophomonas sp.]
MEQEIDLRQVGEIIKKRWLFFITFPLLAALISGIISFYVLKPVYQSSATLIVGKKASNTEEQLERQLLEASRMLAKTYGEIAKSRTVREQVIAQLGLKMTTDELYSKISVSQVEDTEILEITVTDTNPQLAADIANVTVWKFATAVVEIKKIDSVGVIDKAVAPTAPIKPNKMKNILIAFILGLIAAFGLSFLLEYLDNTIKSSKEAEELLGLPVLGVILDYKYNEEYERGEPCANTI